MDTIIGSSDVEVEWFKTSTEADSTTKATTEDTETNEDFNTPNTNSKIS